MIKRGITPQLENGKIMDIFSIRRKEWVDASSSIELLLKYFDRPKKPFFNIHMFNTVTIKRWHAHTSAVNSLTKLKKPAGFISCSLDQWVKLWSLDGDVYGQINLVKLDKSSW